MTATAVKAHLRGISDPHPCECGCGEITNVRHIEAQRMKANGWKNVEIAESFNVTTAAVKVWLRGKPSRFIQGHYGRTGRSPNAYEQACERCGTVMVRSNPTRFCGRFDCVAKHGTGWPAEMHRRIYADTTARRERQKSRLLEWYAARRDKQELRARIRAEREEARCLAREAREARRAEVAARAIAARDRARVRREVGARRRRYRSAEFRELTAARNRALVESEAQEAAKWVAAQPVEVQEFVADGRDRGTGWRSLDAVFSADTKRSLLDIIPAGHYGRRVEVEWADPIGDAIETTEIENVRVLAKHAAIVPENFIERCAEGELELVVDDDGPRFVVRRKQPRTDLLPWRDSPRDQRAQVLIVSGSGPRHGRGGRARQSLHTHGKARGHHKKTNAERMADQSMKSIERAARKERVA